MTKKVGIDFKMYYGSVALTSATIADYAGDWNELTNVRDVTINLETGEADITTRSNTGWRATKATLKDGSIEFEMVWDSADAGFTAIKDAWSNRTEIALMALDGDNTTAGNQGIAGNFSITNFTRSEPLEDAATVSVTAKPSSYTSWYTVTT